MPIGPNGPDYTDLDYPQVLQRVFEESEDRLRVDAEITAVIGVVEVVITDTNDSIKIGNGLGVFADVDAGRNLTVIDVAANATLSSIDSKLSTGITVTQGTSPWVISGNTGRTWVLDNSTDSVESFQGGTWSVDVNNFPATQSVTQGTSPWVISGTVAATQSGTWNINNITGTISLPTGASTLSEQQTQSASLASIDSKLTSPITVTGPLTDTQLRASPVPVSGTITANQGTSPWIIDGTVSASQNGAWTTGRTWVLDDSTDSIASVQSGAWSVGRTWTLSSGTDSVNIGNFPATQSVTQGTTPWIVDGSGFTQPVSGTITALQGTSPWVVSGTVAATQSGTWVLGANSGVDIGDVTVNNGAGAAAVNIQDGGNSITVDGTVTVLQGTSPWVVSGTVTTTTSNDTNYGVVGANTLRTAAQIGNATGAANFGAGTTTAQTLRVVLPTDQTAIPVTQSGTWNIGTVSTITNVVHVDDNGGSLTVDGTVTALQGTSPWVVSGTITTSPDVNVHDGTGVSISSTGSSLNVNVTNTIPVSQSGSWTVTANQGTSPWIVDGSGFTQPISGTVAATQSGTWVLGANSGVDIGDVTINNGAGAAAVNIQDGGNSITVDGTVTVLQGTSPWVVSGTVSTTLSNDTDYGVVGANTLRTAAQIGNATGAADFGAGTTTAQTLRVVLPTDQTAIPVTQSGTWTTGRTWTLSSGTDSVNIGNFPATVAVTQSTSPWVISGAVTLPYDTNYGTVGANTLRTASQIGNATGAANFNAGATGAQTLRTTSNLSDGAGTALTSTIFNSKQSLDVRLNDGFSTATNTRPSIASTTTVLLASNINRRYASIFNQNNKKIFIKYTDAAVVNQGISIDPNTLYKITADDLFTGQINAITTGSSINIEVCEGT